MERSVAKPTPAGNASSHQRNERASCFRKMFTSPPERISAWATKQACSVSSETMPLPKNRWCFVVSRKSFVARREDKPSYGRPSESPTAVPRRQPMNAFLSMLGNRGGDVHRWRHDEQGLVWCGGKHQFCAGIEFQVISFHAIAEDDAVAGHL